MDLRLDKKKLKSFFEYGKVGLLITLAVSVVAFYLLFALTKPTVPRAQRFEILHGGVYLEEGTRAWSQDILALLPDQRACDIQALSLDGLDTGNAYLMMTTRMTSQEGDLFILPYMVYQGMAAGDSFVNLEGPLPEDPQGRTILQALTLPQGLDPELCRVQVETYSAGDYLQAGEICGLPASMLQGLFEIGVVPDDYVICIPDYRDVNIKEAVQVIQWIYDNKQVYTDYEDSE